MGQNDNFSASVRTRTVLLDRKVADVTGNGIPDVISLIGKQAPDAAFVTNITLLVQVGGSGDMIKQPLQNDTGYNPSLFIGDFTHDCIADVEVSIESGGSGGYQFIYIYSFKDAKSTLLFDSDAYNEKYQYSVAYLDNYRVQVDDLFNHQRFTLDVGYKKTDYERLGVYDVDGKLLKPVSGYVSAVDRGLFPIGRSDQGFDAVVSRRIVGVFNADTLGYVNTLLSWNGTRCEFEQKAVEVSIKGHVAS